MFVARVAQVGGLHGRGRGIVTDHQRGEFGAAFGRVAVTVHADAGELAQRVDFEDQARGREDVGRQVRRVGVEHHQLGEGVVLQFGEEVEAGQTREVVEAVAVLQRLHLRLEDEVEGRAQQAAEGHLLFGQAADPQVDVVHARGGDTADHRVDARAVQEGEPVCFVCNEAALRGRASVENHGAAEDECGRHGPLLGHRVDVRGGQRAMRAVRRNEVDDGGFMLEVLREVDPARIGLELRVRGRGVELPPSFVERGNAGVPAARDVDGGEVQRQAQELVAHRVGDELVDLVAHLPGHAAHDGAGRLLRRQCAVVVEPDRVEEGIDQREIARQEIGVQPVHGLGQHRVPDAEHRVCELGDDRRVDRRLVVGFGQELVDGRLHLARELFEHQVLVLHLRREARGLEDALAVP
ncbi:hypothetical protein D9M68_615750 [compost metagenome]